MKTHFLSAMSEAPPIQGPTRSICVGCDDGNFSSPKEFCEAVPLGEGLPRFIKGIGLVLLSLMLM